VITVESCVSEHPHFSVTGEDAAVARYDVRFEAARNRLVRICTGLVGDDAAEDVVHDAYLRGRARIAQLRDPDLFDAWLTRIAVNLCVNRRRRAKRLIALLPMFANRDRGPQPAPRDAGLRELIELLDPRERTLIVLHYGYGYQIDEVARMTGLSSTNARSIVFRARRRLGDQLEKAEG
jgi:RNA polymerase sigma-70 factor (ECF subfamily)